ncbi:hypothetical protein ES705_20943 [subsurface metagenome]
MVWSRCANVNLGDRKILLHLVHKNPHHWMNRGISTLSIVPHHVLSIVVLYPTAWYYLFRHRGPRYTIMHFMIIEVYPFGLPCSQRKMPQRAIPPGSNRSVEPCRAGSRSEVLITLVDPVVHFRVLCRILKHRDHIHPHTSTIPPVGIINCYIIRPCAYFIRHVPVHPVCAGTAHVKPIGFIILAIIRGTRTVYGGNRLVVGPALGCIAKRCVRPSTRIWIATPDVPVNTCPFYGHPIWYVFKVHKFVVITKF